MGNVIITNSSLKGVNIIINEINTIKTDSKNQSSTSKKDTAELFRLSS